MFDTLKYARKLEKSGLNYKIAETQAELQKEIIDKIYNNFDDSKTLPEIYAVFDTLKYVQRLVAVDHEAAIAEVEAELQKEIIKILFNRFLDCSKHSNKL